MSKEAGGRSGGTRAGGPPQAAGGEGTGHRLSGLHPDSTVAAALVQRRVQRRQSGRAEKESPEDVQAAADRGIAGADEPLPHLDAIQKSFQRHKITHVKAHTDGKAAAGAHAMGAQAFAAGDHVAFDGAPDLHTAAHEAAHVIQQQGGVSLSGGVGQAGDPYEQHADAVADRVVQGKSAEDLLDQVAGGGSGGGGRGVQRYAFVNEKQVAKGQKDLTPEMQAMVTDTDVRDYTSLDEFKKHASKSTDYLGNLPDGTWMRFSPTGLNLLGERHTKVTLEEVVPALGTTSFIYEPFATDDMSKTPEMGAAYATESADRFKKFGVDKDKDKQKYGAESLYPKIGYGMTLAQPYFDGSSPVKDLTTGHYAGQPIQRYLKIGWGLSKDNKAEVEKKKQNKEKVQPMAEALCAVHKEVEGKLDGFITSLPIDGFIGDPLSKDENKGLLPLLAKLSKALTDAIAEKATDDPDSGMSEDERKDAKQNGVKEDAKGDLFSKWRDKNFAAAVKAAAGRGVRYAGMGQDHLDVLVQNGLAAGQQGYEMNGKDIAAFKDLTDKLRGAAKPQ